MKSKSRFLLAFAALLAPLNGADQFDALRDSIRKQIVDTGVPSIAVAVARDGKIIWEEGFGWADRERRVTATEHTLYSLASISKPFSATALMTLVQAGKIDLDKPINDYLGNAKIRVRIGKAEDATVRRVANHSSGLPLHYQFFYADEPYHPPTMDETILRYGQLVTMPGEKYEYSNLGFGILGYVIARVSGKTYADYMREAVFRPLGLTHSSVDVGPGLEEMQAVRYGEDGLPIPFYTFDHPAASAVYASAHDLIRFGMFHLKTHLADQRQILTDASIDAMQQPTVAAGMGNGYGIGWAISDRPTGYHVISHTGGMGGVATSLRLIPSQHLAVVVLCNASSPLPHRISDQILNQLLPNWGAIRPPEQSHGPFTPLAELGGTWTGTLSTYKSEIPFTLEIRANGDVHAQLGKQLKALLNEVRWENGSLQGVMTGDVGTEDASRMPYQLSLTLKLRGNSMNGPVSAISLPGKRVGNALTQWAELSRDQSAR